MAALTRVYAAPGPCPVGLTGTTPETVRFWAEELRDRWGEHGRFLALSALCNFARHSLTPADADLVVSQLRLEYADELAQERELFRQSVRGTAEPKPLPPPVSGKERGAPTPTAPAAQPAVAPTRTVNRAGLVFGFPATAVVRWMGANGWGLDRALSTLGRLGVPLAEPTVRTQLAAGAKGDRGGPAPLDPCQVKELTALTT